LTKNSDDANIQQETNNTQKLPTVQLLRKLQQKEYAHQCQSTQHLKLCQSKVNIGWRKKGAADHG